MKTEAAVAHITIRLKKILEPFRNLCVLCACCVLSGLIILIFVYRPLMTKLHDAANRLQEVETELLNQRNAIAALENSEEGHIIQRNEVPLAIAELTKEGRGLGLNFNSISPGQLQETIQAGVTKLPISFMIESEYKNFGQFLTYVEDFSSNTAEVESLFIYPSENDSTKLDVKLVLNLYVEI